MSHNTPAYKISAQSSKAARLLNIPTPSYQSLVDQTKPNIEKSSRFQRTV